MNPKQEQELARLNQMWCSDEYIEGQLSARFKMFRHFPEEYKQSLRKEFKQEQLRKNRILIEKGMLHVFPKSGPLKVGRCCFTCKFCGDRRSNFVTCKHYLPHMPKGEVWEKAKCDRWRLTSKKKRLAQFKKMVHPVNKLTDSKYRSYFYHVNTRDKTRDPEYLSPLYLGRCCFLCEYREPVKRRSLVQCKKQDGQWVWEKGACKSFKLTTDHTRLDRYKKYMNKSGVETAHSVEWIKPALDKPFQAKPPVKPFGYGRIHPPAFIGPLREAVGPLKEALKRDERSSQ